jgi:hypothetical protein
MDFGKGVNADHLGFFNVVWRQEVEVFAVISLDVMLSDASVYLIHSSLAVVGKCGYIRFDDIHEEAIARVLREVLSDLVVGENFECIRQFMRSSEVYFMVGVLLLKLLDKFVHSRG